MSRPEVAAAEWKCGVDLFDRRVVKTHSEGVEHVVVDARVD
jgi:tRNA G37 N-methylase Trm5